MMLAPVFGPCATNEESYHQSVGCPAPIELVQTATIWPLVAWTFPSRMKMTASSRVFCVDESCAQHSIVMPLVIDGRSRVWSWSEVPLLFVPVTPDTDQTVPLSPASAGAAAR